LPNEIILNASNGSVVTITNSLHYQAAVLNFKTENSYTNKSHQVATLFDDYGKFLVYLINVFVSEFLNAKICFYNDNDSYDFGKSSLYRDLDNKRIFANLLQIAKDRNPFNYVHDMNLSFLNLMENPHCVTEYFKHKEVLFQNKDRFKNDELELHLNFLKTYCIEKCYEIEHREKFSNEYIELEFYILEEKLFQSRNTKTLQSRSFRNILLFLANKKEAGRISELIEYSSYLHPDCRTVYRNYAKAYLNYCNGQLPESIKLTKKVNSADKQILLDISLLKLKIYFDTRNYLKGFDKLHSVRRMINKDRKINTERKKRYRVFLNYLEKLFKKIEKDDEAGISLLFQQIFTTHNLLYSEWFKDKHHEIFSIH